MNPSSYIEAYKTIRSVLSSSVSNANKFCNTLSYLTNDKSKRLILNSADSIFNGINLQEILAEKGIKYRLSLAVSLAKIPQAIFLPRFTHEDSESCNLPTLLEDTLDKIENLDKHHHRFNSFLVQLRDTVNYLSYNNLHDNYGPLRPFLIDFLKKYKESLLGCELIGKPRKLYFCLTLLDVLKCFSIDSQDLLYKVKLMIKGSPELITGAPFSSLSYISRLGLEFDGNNLFIDRMRSIAYNNLATIINHLGIIFTKFNHKVDLETYLCALIHRMKIENCSRKDLMQLLRSLKILRSRQRDEDLTNLTNTLLELIYPKLSKYFLSRPLVVSEVSKAAPCSSLAADAAVYKLGVTNESGVEGQLAPESVQISDENGSANPLKTQEESELPDTIVGESELGFNDTLVTKSGSAVATSSENTVNKNHVLLIFETYMKINAKSTFVQNCHEALVNYVLDNKSAFTTTDLIRITHNLNSISCGLSKVLVKNEYLYMNEVASRLLNHLLSQLSTLEFNDLCLVLYQLSLTDHFKFYHVLANCALPKNELSGSYEHDEVRDKVMGIVKNRIIQKLDGNNNTLIYSSFIVDSLMFKDHDFNEYFGPDMMDIIQSLTKNQLLEIILRNNNNRNLNHEVLNGVLNKMSYNLVNVNKLEVLNHLVENNKLVKMRPDLSNKIFSTLVYKLINTKNGYTQLLQAMQHMPKESDKLLVNIIMQYLNKYMISLSIYDVELLLQCANKFDVIHPNLLPLLNYSYDLNISSVQNQVIVSMLTSLKNLKIRHEPLIKKFTDKLLSSFKNSNNYYIPDLISVIDSLSTLCIPYNDLYIYLLNYLSVNAASDTDNMGISRDYKRKLNSFQSLNLKDKICLLNSIANFGIVDHNLKSLYLSVVNEMYPSEVDESDNGMEAEANMDANKNSKLNDVETLLKLYEVHIDLVLNNIYTGEADSISNKLKYPSSLWFTAQELKLQNFKKSNLYITVKDALNSLNVKFESVVTEIYFCNFVIRDGEKSTVVYVVPSEDVLRFWTTNLEKKSLESTPNLSIGNSQKVLRNLKLLGYHVIELQQSRWDSIQSDRTEYLNQLLTSG